MRKSIKIENPVEYELANYHEPLQFGNNNSGFITHQALITHSAYTMKKMYDDGVKWREDLWGDILGETEKAILIDNGKYLTWVPKRLIKKVRKIREIIEVEEDK